MNQQTTPYMSATKLKTRISIILRKQGYQVKPSGFVLKDNQLETKRHAHDLAKVERLSDCAEFIIKESVLIEKYLLNGNQLKINKIQPNIIEVKPGTEMEKIFRWWNLVWWSLPYERAYGRQMRFVIWDEYHNAPIGLIGMQSPILSWEVRDKYLGIEPKDRDYWINQSLSAQRLGALPPYNYILGGKLVALLLTTDIIRKKFTMKYKNQKTVMEGRELPARLLFITTTGAYGKSSVYNRLKMNNEWVAKFIGYTKGSGTFHIPNGIYEDLLIYLKRKNYDIKRGYGTGPSRKMRLINQALEFLGFEDGSKHGVKRAVYLFPLTKNFQNVLKEGKRPVWLHRNIQELTEFWKQRWAIPRSEKNKTYMDFIGNNFLQETLKLISNYQRNKK